MAIREPLLHVILDGAALPDRRIIWEEACTATPLESHLFASEARYSRCTVPATVQAVPEFLDLAASLSADEYRWNPDTVGEERIAHSMDAFVPMLRPPLSAS